jgi:hypothetical protein
VAKWGFSPGAAALYKPPGAAGGIRAAGSIDGHGVDKQEPACLRGEERGFSEKPPGFSGNPLEILE